MNIPFAFHDEGSVILINPRTPEAVAWLQEHLEEPEPWQFFGPSLVVDRRLAMPILEAIQEEFGNG